MRRKKRFGPEGAEQQPVGPELVSRPFDGGHPCRSTPSGLTLVVAAVSRRLHLRLFTAGPFAARIYHLAERAPSFIRQLESNSAVWACFGPSSLGSARSR